MPDPRPTTTPQSDPAQPEASANPGRPGDVARSATPGRPPAFGAGLVSRPRLLRRLADSIAAPLVLVAAPAGYGKTTLLSDWARRDGRAFAWIDVDDSLNDPSRLVAAMTVALDACSGPRSAAAVTRLPARASTLDLRRLDRCLAGRPPFVLVLDGAQDLRSAATLDVVRALAAGVPDGSQIVLATRTEPSIPVGRMRAHRTLTEIRADELGMTAAEAGALLALAGVVLSARDLEILVARTEGWPACLYLAALALRDALDLPGAVAAFRADDALLATYLRDEVLGPLPARSLDFLRRSSVVERLSGGLCDALLERGGSAILLDELAGA
jgi:LuxR family maltose regulon positive regulatory protein